MQSSPGLDQFDEEVKQLVPGYEQLSWEIVYPRVVNDDHPVML